MPYPNTASVCQARAGADARYVKRMYIFTVVCRVYAVDFLARKGKRRNHAAACTVCGTRNINNCSGIVPTSETPNSLLSNTLDITFYTQF